jgi:hypothetical protein
LRDTGFWILDSGALNGFDALLIGTEIASFGSMERREVRQNVAGASTRAMARERKVGRRIIGAYGLFCLAVILCFNLFNYFVLRMASWLVLLCLVGMWGVTRLFPVMDWLWKREGDATRGAVAEESVGKMLAGLSNDYTVTHDVPGAYGNIDHLVFRKDGAVFLIETKSHRGRVSAQNGELLVNGKRPEKNFISIINRNAAGLSEELHARLGVTPWVHSAIVFTNAYVERHCKIGHVTVMNARYLQKWMAGAAGQREFARRMEEKLQDPTPDKGKNSKSKIQENSKIQGSGQVRINTNWREFFTKGNEVNEGRAECEADARRAKAGRA